MSKRIKVADLPEFDAAHYLDSETSIAAYLTDILEANDASLLASALGDIARARGMTEIAKTSRDHAGSFVQSSTSRQCSPIRYREPGVRRPWSASCGPACSSHARDSLKLGATHMKTAWDRYIEQQLTDPIMSSTPTRTN